MVIILIGITEISFYLGLIRTADQKLPTQLYDNYLNRNY